MQPSSRLHRSLSPRTGVIAAIALAAAFAITLGASQPADAAVHRYVVIGKTAAANITGGVFASCKITSNGGTCSIVRGRSIDRTVAVSLGASRAEVSAGLSISSARGVTTTVGCNSPALKAGQTWKARAVGTRFNYRVQKQEAYKPRVGPTSWKTITTSAPLTAFNPYASAISCGL